MATIVSSNGKFLRKPIIIIRIVGIVIMLLGLGLKIADLPGFTTAFIAGAVLIVFSRLYQWLRKPRQDSYL